MNEASTREREISALTEAMQELQLTEASIITLEEREEQTTSAGKVRIIPLWRFLTC